MSSKKKVTLSACNICDAVIAPRDAPKHNCSTPLAEVEIPTILKSVMKCPNVGLEKASSYIPPDVVGWETENCVLMHIQTMEAMSIEPRSPVRISSDDQFTESIVCLAWPCKELTPLKVHVINGGFPREKSVFVELCEKIQKVDLLSVRVETQLILNYPLKEYLQHYLSNSYLVPGQSVFVKYLFQKVKIVIEPPPLEEHFANMNVASSSTVLSLQPGCLLNILDDNAVEESTGPNDLSDVGGATSAKQILTEYVVGPMTRSEKPCSVLLWGLPGSGKTFLLKKLAKILKTNAVYISSVDELAYKAEQLTKIKSQKTILIADLNELEEGSSKTKVLNDLLSSRDLKMILSLRTADSLDIGLRVRFPIEAELTVPTQAERMEIMKLAGRDDGLTEEEMRHVASVTHGFTAGDLMALLDASKVSSEKTKMAKIESARKRMRPTGIRQFILEVPSVSWSDIGGNDELKLEIQQAVIWPQKHPEAFERFGIDPPSGILLYGPPGCSKTLIARALANEAKMNFLSVKGPELFSKWVGDSEKAIRDLFARARQVAPTIVFFDEIDAVGSSRGSEKSSGVSDRVLAQLLTELDGLEKQSKVILLAATNRPDQLDSALLRPGRLDRAIYVGLPCDATRRAILEMRTKKMKLAESDLIEHLVNTTKGYSGAELVAVCRTAAMFAMRENIESTTVERRHFEEALKAVVARTESYLLDIYEDFKAGRTSNA